MDSPFIEYIENYLKDTHLKPVEIIIRGEKKNKVIEVFVDSEEGLSIDDLANASRGLNEVFDSNGLSAELAKIVISSPGAEKPFKYLWQLNKHINRILQIELNDGETLTAKLISVNENNTITVEPVLKGKKKKDENTAEREIAFSNVKESKVKLKF